MNVLGGFNWLDILIFLLLILGLGIGYAQGLLRQMIGLAALYIGTILGAQYFFVVSGWMRALFTTAPSRFINALAFLIILGVVTTLINWLAYDAYHSMKLRLLPLVDHLGGSLLGLITAVTIISLALPLMTFATGEPWPWAEPTRLLIIAGLQTSRLLPIFDSLKLTLLNVLAPWLPSGLPSIFNL